MGRLRHMRIVSRAVNMAKAAWRSERSRISYLTGRTEMCPVCADNKHLDDEFCSTACHDRYLTERAF